MVRKTGGLADRYSARSCCVGCCLAFILLRSTWLFDGSVFDVDDPSIPEPRKNGFTFTATDESVSYTAITVQFEKEPTVCE